MTYQIVHIIQISGFLPISTLSSISLPLFSNFVPLATLKIIPKSTQTKYKNLLGNLKLDQIALYYIY